MTCTMFNLEDKAAAITAVLSFSAKSHVNTKTHNVSFCLLMPSNRPTVYMCGPCWR